MQKSLDPKRFWNQQKYNLKIIKIKKHNDTHTHTMYDMWNALLNMMVVFKVNLSIDQCLNIAFANSSSSLLPWE